MQANGSEIIIIFRNQIPHHWETTSFSREEKPRKEELHEYGTCRAVLEELSFLRDDFLSKEEFLQRVKTIMNENSEQCARPYVLSLFVD